MHRAIVRQAVHSNITGLLKNEIQIVWRTLNTNNDHDEKSNEVNLRDENVWDIPRVNGVVVIDRDALRDRLDKLAQNGRREIPIFARPMEQIRLLWSWSFRGKEDLSWCTELAFAGVLYDAESVGHWARACVKRGPIQTSQTNPLISGIELPPLK